MSGFFGKIKDVGKDALGTFVEFEEETPDGDATVALPTPPAGSRPVAPAPAAPPPRAPVAGEADVEFVQQLRAATDGSGKPAYKQFHALYDALAVVPDPVQRAQAALSAARASHGVDAGAVAEAIEDRLRILDEEKGAFDRAVKTEADQAVGGTQAQIDKARADIAKRQEEIRALEARAAELELALNEARATLDASSARFAASYAVVHAELAAERARIAPFVTPKL
ncbi:MAG TPA: hypothetical protein VE913_15050 [Longimicrobium sp.]|nr:hypothetical protein [Longimicrobium sp.]